MTTETLMVDVTGAQLAGQLWRPDEPPRAVVLMCPGSGPSDRHNDVYFPPIRTALLDHGCAVASFDKRGVGDSTGSWLTSGIDEQAADAQHLVAAVAREIPDAPVGVFGHSQGGWVALEVAGVADFVIVNSGPGVTPEAQERVATARRLATAAGDPQEFADAVICFDLVLTCMSSGVPFDHVTPIVERAGLGHVHSRPELFSIPIDSPEFWPLAAMIIDHDPRPAMRSLAVPTLVMFGDDDALVPVDASVAAYRANVTANLLRIERFPGGDHRIQRDGEFVDGYVAAIRSFLDDVLD